MKTTFSLENNDFVMAFEGRLDTNAATQTGKEMEVLNDCEGHDIILDCTELSYISSSGLRLFLCVLKNAKAKGSAVRIKGLNSDLKRIFDEIGFTNLFTFV